MPSVIFKQAQPGAAATSGIHTVTAGMNGIFNLYICNKGAAIAKARISLLNAGTETFLEYDLPLAVAGEVGNAASFTAIKAPAGTVVKVYNNLATIDFTLEGIEEVI